MGRGERDEASVDTLELPIGPAAPRVSPQLRARWLREAGRVSELPIQREPGELPQRFLLGTIRSTLDDARLERVGVSVFAHDLDEVVAELRDAACSYTSIPTVWDLGTDLRAEVEAVRISSVVSLGEPQTLPRRKLRAYEEACGQRGVAWAEHRELDWDEQYERERRQGRTAGGSTANYLRVFSRIGGKAGIGLSDRWHGEEWSKELLAALGEGYADVYKQHGLYRLDEHAVLRVPVQITLTARGRGTFDENGNEEAEEASVSIQL